VRVKPSALLAILICIGYCIVVFTMWVIVDIDYDTVSDTVQNVREGVVYSVAAGAVYLIIVATALGWWKPAIHEPRKAGKGWMWVVPGLLLVGALLNLVSTKWGDIDQVGQYVLWVVIGVALVGFSEEMLTRGLAIVGARGSMHEKWVWAFSGLLFGLLHVPNAFFGQGGRETVQQVFFAFFVGLAYYVTRRIAGTLVVTMVLHALWDGSLFIQQHSTDSIPIGGVVMTPAVIVAIFALVKILKEGDEVEPGADQLAAFEKV
jgi:membrane protease YdiL (CAAX protease family)